MVGLNLEKLWSGRADLIFYVKANGWDTAIKESYQSFKKVKH